MSNRTSEAPIVLYRYDFRKLCGQVINEGTDRGQEALSIGDQRRECGIRRRANPGGRVAAVLIALSKCVRRSQP